MQLVKFFSIPKILDTFLIKKKSNSFHFSVRFRFLTSKLLKRHLWMHLVTKIFISAKYISLNRTYFTSQIFIIFSNLKKM